MINFGNQGPVFKMRLTTALDWQARFVLTQQRCPYCGHTLRKVKEDLEAPAIGYALVLEAQCTICRYGEHEVKIGIDALTAMRQFAMGNL